MPLCRPVKGNKVREETLVFRPKRRVGPAEGYRVLSLQPGASVAHGTISRDAQKPPSQSDEVAYPGFGVNERPRKRRAAGKKSLRSRARATSSCLIGRVGRYGGQALLKPPPRNRRSRRRRFAGLSRVTKRVRKRWGLGRSVAWGPLRVSG